jgi:hypothetical protein
MHKKQKSRPEDGNFLMHCAVKIIHQLVYVHPVPESSLLYCHIESTASAEAFYPVGFEHRLKLRIFI